MEMLLSLSGKPALLGPKPQASAHLLVKVQKHTLIATTLHYSFPTRSAAFLSLSEHAVIGHWKKALRGIGDSQALNRALLGDRKKKKKIKVEPENLPIQTSCCSELNPIRRDYLNFF